MPLNQNMNSEIHVADRKKWRSWLIKNHAKETEVWLVYYKKHTGKPTIIYIDSVEEALCFGWIDGIKKNKKAWNNFNNLGSSYRKQCISWLLSAKKPETMESS